MKELIGDIVDSVNFLPNSYCKVVGKTQIHCCLNGVFVALEIKKSGSARMTDNQRKDLENIILAKGTAFVVFPNNWKETLDFLKQIACEKSNFESNISSH